MAHFDAIIIGAGVIGSSIALSLSRNGVRTLNIDQNPAAGYGSTSHSSAIIRPFYSHITSAAVAHEARHRWLDWPAFLASEAAEVTANYNETGGLVLIREGYEADYAANIKVLEALNIEHQLLDCQALSELYPGMSFTTYGPPRVLNDPGFGQANQGRIVAGIFINACGYVSDPQLAAQNLSTAAIRSGASFRFNARVTSIEQTDNGIQGLTLNGTEQLSAPLIINAAGPHSSRINMMAGVTLPISTHAHRHEVAYSKAPAGFSENAGFLVDLDSGFYARPDGSDLLIGSTDPSCDQADIVDPDDYNDTFTDQWTIQVYRAAQRLPQLGIENSARGTVGLYDVSDDWIPVYDRSDLPGYYVAIGTSGNQFKNAPVVGDIMAAIINTADHDLTPATLDLQHVSSQIDLSFYSRMRDVKDTASVLA